MRLMQLVSPALPVGAYAYSQGLEYAVDSGWVANEKTAMDWMQELNFGTTIYCLCVKRRNLSQKTFKWANH